MCVVSALLSVGFVLPLHQAARQASVSWQDVQAGPASVRGELAGRAGGLQLKVTPPSPDIRTSYSAEEDKALRVCRIEFAPYPAGKYNKIVDEGDGRAAAFDQCRQDLPALASWSDEEIEATYNAIQSTPLELLVNTPIGPFFLLSSFAIWRDGLSAWNIPPCKEYLDLCQYVPNIQFSG